MLFSIALSATIGFIMKIMKGLKNAIKNGSRFGVKGKFHISYGTDICKALYVRDTRLCRPKWQNKILRDLRKQNV